VLLTSAALAALTFVGNAVAQDNPVVLDSSALPASENSISPAVVALQEAAPPEPLLLVTAQAQPDQSAEDFIVAEQLRNLIENKLAQYVQHQRIGPASVVLPRRNFAALVAGGATLPRVNKRRSTFQASQPTASIRPTIRRRARRESNGWLSTNSR
jgi:hypothetical protein